MQNLDPAGNYSDDEVKDALAGVSGTRDWSFRYERLDKNNRYIDDIDFVESCTIDNNIFADIKRTAKFKIYDQGNINYLSDRIKPYVRLNMPKDEGSQYAGVVEKLEPSIWYKLDDPTTLIDSVNVPLPVIAGTQTHNSKETAYVLPESAFPEYSSEAIQIAANSSSIRGEFWYKFEVKDPAPFAIGVMSTTSAGWTSSSVLTEVFFSASPTDYNLSKVSELVQGSFGGSTLTVARPKLGSYWVRVTPIGNLVTTIYVSGSLQISLTDSSSNDFDTVSDISYERGAPIVGDGGYGTSDASWASTYVESSTENKGGLRSEEGTWTINFWANRVKDPRNNGLPNYTRVRTMTGGYKQTVFDTLLIEEGETLTIKVGTAFSGPHDSDDEFEGVSVTLPLSQLENARGNMFTFVLNPKMSSISIWVNGAPVKGIEANNGFMLSNHADLLKTMVSFFMVDLMKYRMDDMSLYTKELSGSEIRKLFRTGSVEAKDRPGYVEWPQGVFLLSSPTRTFSEGNTSSREVEAYDQLLALREDSYDYRYTAPKGANCVETIDTILGTHRRVNWALDPLLVSNAAFSVYNPSSTSGYSNNVTNQPTRPGAPAETRAIRVNQTSTGSNPSAIIWIRLAPIQETGTYTVKFWVKSSDTCNVNVNTSGTVGAPFKTLPAGVWTQMEFGNINIPAGPANWSSVYVSFSGYTNPTGTYEISEPLVEKGSAGSWFSGSSVTTDQDAYTWDGVPNGSASIRVNGARRITKSDQTFTEAMEWDPGTPKLQIVNDILAYINYDSAWYDENGVFVGQPYLSPAQRGSEFTYATDSTSVITDGDISQTLDLFSVPNKWVLVVSDPETTPMVASYVNADPMSPTSTVARGRTIVDYREEQSASDLATLEAKAARLAFEASQVYEKVEFSTGLMPIHSNGDTYDILVDELAIRNKYNETAWSLPLEAGASMKHQVRRIVEV